MTVLVPLTKNKYTSPFTPTYLRVWCSAVHVRDVTVAIGAEADKEESRIEANAEDEGSGQSRRRYSICQTRRHW